jgi:Histidine kinase
MTIESPRRQWLCLTVRVLRAWRGITFRQWAWTTGIALVLTLAYALSMLPPILLITPNVIGVQPPAWTAARSVALVISGLATAYCFLLALSVAECDRARSRSRAWRYVVAGCAATGAGVLIESAMYLLVPSFAPRRGWGAETNHVIGFAVWSAANFGLTGGLVLAVYARFQSARFAREAFNMAELDRVGASRQVLASRLVAMQAQIEPQFLLGTLAQVEALYESYPQAGDRMLDGLIAYLRMALPQLRRARSTVARETQLAESYLRIVQLRMGSRLAYTVDVQSGVGENDFPPMLLLPLIDDALRNGFEPLPHGGTIAISAGATGNRVRVLVADDGLPRNASSAQGIGMGLLRDRLRGLYGDRAHLELAANTPHGVIATIEVPLATARDHC